MSWAPEKFQNVAPCGEKDKNKKRTASNAQLAKGAAGPSRRELQVIFSTDQVERAKIMRFLQLLSPGVNT